MEFLLAWRECARDHHGSPGVRLQTQPAGSRCQLKDIKVVVCVAMTIRFQALRQKGDARINAS